jgi:predicted ATPase
MRALQNGVHWYLTKPFSQSELLACIRETLKLPQWRPLIVAAATLGAEMLKGAPEVQVVMTNREPLRSEVEHVHRLSQLASPTASAGLAAAQALGLPAVQLFVERVRASLGDSNSRMPAFRSWRISNRSARRQGREGEMAQLESEHTTMAPPGDIDADAQAEPGAAPPPRA